MPSPTYTLAETFRLSNRVTLRLLCALTGEQLGHAANPRARSIADQFAHLYGVRASWLEACAKSKLPKLPKDALGGDVLARALEESAEAVARLLESAEAAGKLPNFPRGPAAFLGYLIAHEAHHRGQILLALKHAGMPVPKETAFALWEWGKL